MNYICPVLGFFFVFEVTSDKKRDIKLLLAVRMGVKHGDFKYGLRLVVIRCS